MSITINGDVYITNYGQTLDELVGEELSFDDCDCDIKEYEMDCDECGFCDLDCDDCEFEDEVIEFDLDNDERFDDYSDEYKQLLSRYVKKVYETDFCPYCIADIFDEFYGKEI